MDDIAAVMPKTKTSCTAGLFEGYGGNDVSNEWMETCPSGYLSPDSHSHSHPWMNRSKA
jgi:hypothetical protein